MAGGGHPPAEPALLATGRCRVGDTADRGSEDVPQTPDRLRLAEGVSLGQNVQARFRRHFVLRQCVPQLRHALDRDFEAHRLALLRAESKALLTAAAKASAAATFVMQAGTESAVEPERLAA